MDKKSALASALIACVSVLVILAFRPDVDSLVSSEEWAALGTGYPGSSVLALAVMGSHVFAGGNGGFLQEWDGASWSLISVNALPVVAAATDTALYVGGDFTSIGGVSANRIAKFNGTTWSAMGDGFNLRVSSIAIDDTGTVYAGGIFTMSGSKTIYRIARWDDTTWTQVGAGFPEMSNTPHVDALAFDGDGNLYAGGALYNASSNLDRIAKWDGISWTTVGGGADSDVKALAFDTAGTLYVGGSFFHVGGIPIRYLASWDGVAWDSVGTPQLNNQVVALKADAAGNLFAGGVFTTAGGDTVNFIAKWDGAAWDSLGAGMNNIVTGLDMLGDTLVAAGAFTMAGSVPANRIAKWATPAPLPVEMTGLEALVDGESVRLSWSTRSETGNAGFEIEHAVVTGSSFGPRSWAATGFVPGQGTTRSPRFYSHRIDDLDPGRHAFRLKQIDLDGSFHYSNIVEAVIEAPGTHFLSAAYPNPFNPSSAFTLTVSREQRVRVDLFDASGRRVQTLFEGAVPASEAMRVEISGRSLPSGLYMYRAAGEYFSETRTLMLVR